MRETTSSIHVPRRRRLKRPRAYLALAAVSTALSLGGAWLAIVLAR